MSCDLDLECDGVESVTPLRVGHDQRPVGVGQHTSCPVLPPGKIRRPMKRFERDGVDPLDPPAGIDAAQGVALQEATSGIVDHHHVCPEGLPGRHAEWLTPTDRATQR